MLFKLITDLLHIQPALLCMSTLLQFNPTSFYSCKSNLAQLRTKPSFPRRRDSRNFKTRWFILAPRLIVSPASRLFGYDGSYCRVAANFFLLPLIVLLLTIQSASAHHVLGRPSYSLGEGSNTPPSMQVETQIGKFYVTYMVFPAFPKPNENGRVNLYAQRISNGNPLVADITFKVRDDKWLGGWFSKKVEEVIGVQKIDDGVYRQGFLFKEAGDYIITAEFSADGEPYTIDFPLKIGDPFPVGPIGLSVFVIIAVLFTVNLTQRKRLQRMKAQQHHADADSTVL